MPDIGIPERSYVQVRECSYLPSGMLHPMPRYFSQGLLIHVNLSSDEDSLILRRLHSFLIHQKLFVKLLSGTQSGKFNFNIYIRFISRQLDQISGKINDLNWLSHIEYEDLSILA